MSKRVIIDPENHPVQPQHINAKEHFWGAFGNHEKEVSAGWIVRLCQEIGSWEPFTASQLEEFYNKAGHRGFQFNGLDSDGLIVIDKGRCWVTHKFIAQCFGSSPATSSVAQG